MSKLKIGIIGVGSIAESHIAAYLANEDVELYAFCDIREERLKEMGEKYGVTRLFTNKEDMLALSEIDAVSVCTWNSEHAPCTIAALNAGKHVLCEKPMATNVDDAIAMKEAAEKNNKLLMIGFVRRHGNDAKIVRDFLEKDSLGELYYAKATYIRRNGNPEGWFGDKSRSGGGPMVDLGVHVIDLVRYLSGNPKPVSVYGAAFHKLGNRDGKIGAPKYLSASATGHDICDVEDLATAMIRFENGEVLSVETSFCLNTGENKGEVEIFGTKAGVKLGAEKIELTNDINDYLTNVTFDAPSAFDFSKSFENEVKNFTDSIQGKAECIAPAQDGIDIMRILCAIYESAETGHEVLL